MTSLSGCAAPESRSLRLLIVEDDAIIALGLRQMVDLCGHQVCHVASTADEAVAVAERDRPDLILMDVMLADGSDGIDAATTIRQRLGIRSLFMSALDICRLRARAAIAEPVGILQKPYSTADLRHHLARIAGLPGSGTGDRGGGTGGRRPAPNHDTAALRPA